MTDTARDTLDRLAGRLGGIVWISEMLFGLQGTWAETMGDDRAVAHLATASRHHGWHVELVSDLLPDSPALHGPDRVVAPPGWAAAAVLASEASGDAARLGVLYRSLVPRLAGAVDAVIRSTSGPGDTAIARGLSLVAGDVVDDLVGGSALLGAALTEESAVRAAAEAVMELDLAFAHR